MKYKSCITLLKVILLFSYLGKDAGTPYRRFPLQKDTDNNNYYYNRNYYYFSSIACDAP